MQSSPIGVPSSVKFRATARQKDSFLQEQKLRIRTLRGWAIDVLLVAGAIPECEEHGWARDRPIRTRAHAPSVSPVRIRPMASLQTKRTQKSETS